MASDTPPQLGLRERKKREAMARMRAAARDLMWDRGYDAVTTKEIAARADVGEATLFRYFPSKLDLFLMVYGEEFERVIDACAAQEAENHTTPSRDAGAYVDRILACYRMFADLYVRYPDLAFTYVKESFGAHTDVAQSGLTYADRWFELLEAIVAQAQAARAFAGIDPAIIVQNCHALYVHEVLRSHARGLSSAKLPDRLAHRLEALLRPLQILPKGKWLEQLASI
ncbi:TetR/AcrR family transcriptional regulator [Nocardioides albidus]|uniref:TetR/AcrR family transcriptional regulator n=1 Tax=Nocardioides albidus TaxID=1517589 RepID=A0A5C4W1F7_9ACTN|nr:TetR/AcrR family transcriptional regulator [Nocardioides albidus]TNM41913.1 TetR/AcrR family transcriptional regulator [Nocardioides albidus]